jgi:hypothetical protein
VIVRFTALTLAVPRAAVLQDLRRPLPRGDEDVGKRLVVAQQHIETRPQALDQVRLEQQRLGFGRGRHELDARGHRDHAGDTRDEAGRPRIGEDALLEVLRFADIEHVAASVEHAIDARPRRRHFGVMEDRGAPCSERTSVLVKAKLGRFLFRLRQRLLFVVFDDLRLGSQIWFGNAAHARGCRPIGRDSHMRAEKRIRCPLQSRRRPAAFPIYDPLTMRRRTPYRFNTV